MAYQVLNEKLIVCFNCGTAEGHFYEWEDDSNREKPSCPQCRQAHTLPKYYLEEMSIPALQQYLSDIVEETGIIPLLDYSFKDFKMPGAIVCSHHLSAKYVG